MNLKTLLLTLTTLIFIGCTPNNPTPSSYSQNTQPTNTQAILKLDTKGHTAKISDIIVTKSGDIISSSDDKTIRVWDSTTGKEKRKILGQIGAGSEGKIFAMALSPNEEFLAVGGMFVGAKKFKKDPHDDIRIYNYKTGVLLKVLKSHRNVVHDLAFSRDGKYLISGSGDFTAKIWQTEDFSLIDTISFHTNDVYAVKIIKNRGDYFAITAGFDNQIALYDMAQRKVVKSYRKNYKLNYLAVSQNHIAVCGFNSKEIAIYDLSLNPIKTIISETKPWGLAYSPNGEFLIAGAGNHPLNVNIYSVKRAYQKIQSFQKHTNALQAVAFLDNQTAISGGGNNNEIYIWKSKTAQVLKKIEGVGERVWSVGVDGESIAWGNIGMKRTNEHAKLQKSINLKTLQIGENLRGKSGKFKRISTKRSNGFSLRHRAGGDYGKSDAVLDIKRDGRVVASITRGATNGLSHRCYGFYKEYIISGGSNGHLKIYNLQGQEVVNLVGHTGEVWSIALDGDRLVSGSSDQTIRIWDLGKLKMKSEERKMTIYPQLSLFITKTNEWIAWTPQGFYHASKGGEKYIGYHINRGTEHEAEFMSIDKFYKFHRADLIAKALNGEDLTPYAQKINIDALLKGGIPPKVTIMNPSNEYNNPNKQGEYRVDIQICSQGRWSGDIKLYRGNSIVGSVSQDSKAFRERKVVTNKCSVVEGIMLLENGDNTIGVKAITQQDMESNLDTRRVNYKSPYLHRKPNLYIVTLSVNEYDDERVNDLHYTHDDADAIVARVKKVGGSVFKNIYSRSLKDKMVTRENIFKTFKEIGKETKADDVFMMFISGHGVFDKELREYFFIPSACHEDDDLEQKAIGQKVLFDALSHIQTRKSVLLLDTCQSGGVIDKDVEKSALEAFGTRTNKAILSASTKKQYAKEGYKNHGVFTYTILEAMNHPKVYNYNNKLLISHIANFVKNEMPKKTKEKWGHIQNAKFFKSNTDMEIVIGGK